MGGLLVALAILVGWQVAAGLGHVDRMMSERSATLRRLVATELPNVARYGAARRERLDEVLAEVAAGPDVRGVLLERSDGAVRLVHGTLPGPLPDGAAEGRFLHGSTLLVVGPARIDTRNCHACAAGGGHETCAAAGAGPDLDGDYRVVLALDATPYLRLRRTVWMQGAAGGLLLLALAASLWLHQRQTRRASAMREALAVADERTRYLERLGLVAGGLAHQIKNPVGALRGFAQLIAERTPPGSPEAGYAGLMVTELDGITRRVDRLRGFARPEPPNLEPGHPAEIVRRVAALLEPDLVARRLHLDLDLPEGDGPEAMVDRERLSDLVVNLVMNAIEASPNGGTVRVRLAQEPGGQLVFQVSDEGPGFAPRDGARVVRPFHSTKPGGLGLGLAVAQQVAEDHGGRLDIGDTSGGGALVSARWPRSAAGGG